MALTKNSPRFGVLLHAITKCDRQYIWSDLSCFKGCFKKLGDVTRKRERERERERERKRETERNRTIYIQLEKLLAEESTETVSLPSVWTCSTSSVWCSLVGAMHLVCVCVCVCERENERDRERERERETGRERERETDTLFPAGWNVSRVISSYLQQK